MKLAAIPDPTVPLAITNYALEHKFHIHWILGDDTWPDIRKKFYEATKKAESLGCTEFCVHELRQEYDVDTNEDRWLISIVAFAPR